MKQIQAAQEALPLASFASPQPPQVAGLSPFTVAGMQLVPSLAQTSPAEQSLFGLQPLFQELINRVLSFSPPQEAFQLGGGGGRGGGGGIGAGGPIAFPQFTPLPASAFGGGAQVPIPEITNVGPSVPIAPLLPTGPIAPPSRQEAAAPQPAPLQLVANPFGPPGSFVPLSGQLVPSPFGGPPIDQSLLDAFLIADAANQQRQGP